MRNTLIMENNASIYGDVLSTADFKFNDKANIYGEVIRVEESGQFPPKEMPALPPGLPGRGKLKVNKNTNHTISSDGYYEKIEVDGQLVVDVGPANNKRTIRVGKLTMENNAALKIIGEGKLELYIEKSISMGNKALFNSDGSSAKAVVYYYYGTEPLANENAFNCTNNVTFIGSLVTNVNVSIKGIVSGAIITGGKSVILSTGNTSLLGLIYAPQAKVVLANSITVEGAVICDSCILKNNSKLRYNPLVQDIYDAFFAGGIGGSNANVTPGPSTWSPR